MSTATRNGKAHATRSAGRRHGDRAGWTDLSAYLEEKVYPALYDRLDSAFPEFSFRSSGDKKVATNFPADLPYTVEHHKADRLVCYAGRPWQFMIHGHQPMRWLDYVNKGRKPKGADFLAAVKSLCEKADVPFPQRKMTAEEQEQAQRWEERRTALAAVLEDCREALWSDAGDHARAYMRERGFTDADLRELGVGLYPSPDAIKKGLHSRGLDLRAAKDASLLWECLAGYIVFPWPDAAGGTMTLYGRWPGKPPLMNDWPAWDAVLRGTRVLGAAVG